MILSLMDQRADLGSYAVDTDGAACELPSPPAGRYFASAVVDRLNRNRVAGTAERDVNDDIREGLSTLRQRSQHEYESNPTVEGIVNTHSADMVGRNGPTLSIQSSSKRFSERVESAWASFWESPDVNGELAGSDFLNQAIIQEWLCGEWLWKITDSGETPVKGESALRLYGIHPQRLETPTDKVQSVDMGIERNKTGKPQNFWICNKDESRPMYPSFDFEKIPAEQMIHGFRARLPGQARGWPRLASSLNTVGYIADYDDQVLDAARAAANHGVLLASEDPSSRYIDVNESVDMERGTVRTLPPGWMPHQLKPEQPTTKYSEYRGERHRDIGRPAGMPLMMVRLDSSGHNYSSARFDSQIYWKFITQHQDWICRRALSRLLGLIVAELRASGFVRVPDRGYKAVWTWDPQPHVDPVKESEAVNIQLENGTLPWSWACRTYGRDPDAVRAQRVRDQEADAAVGLETTPAATAGGKPDAED